jgi:hypothetical protein
MAFYGTGFGYSGFAPSYAFAPTAFAAAPAEHTSQAADGSQAGEEHASQSVSGFAADPNAAFFYGQPYAHGAPLVYGQHTVLPSTVLPSTTLVPVAGPRVRRPGYNERLVAWRNRQKAFNRYKKAAKEAIKNANRVPVAAAPAYTSFAAPHPTFYGAPTMYGAPFGAAPFGATYISAPFYEQAAVAPVAEAQEAYPTFGDFSQSGSAQHAEAAEEPEIRGTQV